MVRPPCPASMLLHGTVGVYGIEVGSFLFQRDLDIFQALPDYPKFDEPVLQVAYANATTLMQMHRLKGTNTQHSGHMDQNTSN